MVASELFAQRDGFVCRSCFLQAHQTEASRLAGGADLSPGLVASILTLLQIPLGELTSVWDALTDKRPKGWR